MKSLKNSTLFIADSSIGSGCQTVPGAVYHQVVMQAPPAHQRELLLDE
jgi:hypothetical protein